MAEPDAVGDGPELSVVVPAHNEADYLAPAIAGVLHGLRERHGAFEVLIVENGSSDDTARVARRIQEEEPEARLLSLPVADYGNALKTGFLAASGTWVVVFDVDYVDLGFLEHALKTAESLGAVIVVGSKRSPGADDQRGFGRKLVTAIFSGILRSGFGLQVSDTHGLKLLRRLELTPMVAMCRFGREIFDTELVLRAERAGLPVTEIPVRVVDQRPPRSSIVRRIPRTLLGLVRLRLALGRTPARSAAPWPSGR